MKVLQVRFQNLNSLAGEWSINLTHDDYVSDGIFAITGPTGAGKSTILDAICLALYGATPRLGKITAATNEIMTRHTGECFAEATFATPTGTYRAHWGQRRARGRADGRLQSAQHELYDVGTNTLIAESVRDTPSKVDEVTGLDFTRFTRSMMLAQGDFAAFLSANSSDRSAILEQITGTEIYGQLSQVVHEQRRAEHTTLNELQAGLDGITLLTGDDEAELRTELDRLTADGARLDGEITAVTTKLSWHTTIATLTSELANLKTADAALTARETAFASERERLRLAQLALNVNADYQAVCSLRTRLKTTDEAISTQSAARAAAATALQTATTALQVAQEAAAAARTSRSDANPTLTKAREVGAKLSAAEQQVTEITERLTKLDADRETLVRAADADAQTRAAVEASRATLATTLADTASDEALVSELAGFTERATALSNAAKQAATLAGDIDAATAAVAQAKEAHGTTEAAATQTTMAAAAAATALDEARAQLETVLDGATITEWRANEATLQDQSRALHTAHTTHGSLTSLVGQHAADDERHTELLAALALADAKLRAQEHTYELAESARDAVQREQFLEHKVASLEAERERLISGEPCPLCGAAEHPFADGGVPTPGDTEQRLVDLTGKLNAASDAVTATKVMLGELRVEVAAVDKARATAAEQRTKLERNLSDLLTTAGLSLPHELCSSTVAELVELGELIEQRILTADETLRTLGTSLQRAAALEAEAQTARDALAAATEASHQAASAHQEAEHAHSTAVDALARLEQARTTSAGEHDSALCKLANDLAVFEVGAVTLASLDEVIGSLATRRDAWRQACSEADDAQAQLDTLDATTATRTAQRNDLDTRLGEQRAQLSKLEQTVRELTETQRELLGDDTADQLQQRLDDALEAANTAYETAREQHQADARTVNELDTKLAGLSETLNSCTSELANTEPSLATAIADLGFADEAALAAAVLPVDERELLARQADALDTARTTHDANVADRTARIATEQARALTERTPDELQAELDTLTTSRAAITEQVGGVKQRLDTNAEQASKHAEKACEIAAQRVEFDRWDALHTLIGSADGKKFRTFAQGLTFEVMIGHANRQLTKLTDRYLLVRDTAEPLEISVIDQYQGGEVRSTKNLSGGESFMVSLALALGLSQMASKNVRVDSLFLDEGFGTLDEDTLDTALDTLANLRADGKLIGVISHVGALQERITTQICVERGPDGRSTLDGPGCSRGTSSA